MASATRDVNAASPRDSLTGVAARSVPVTKSHPLPLPTPPNSISPGLPAHGLRAQLQKARLEPIESDLDLQQEAATAAAAAGAGAPHVARAGSPAYDSSGDISPGMLAKHHLPEILLSHGPLAIRHVMGYLTTSVPGFSGIPPAKARRLVVAALEGKGNGTEGAGLKGDVIFEKVGWGRWDARRCGHPARRELSPPVPEGMGIPISSVRWDGRPQPSGSDASACAFSHDDHDCDMNMMENEADKMSMDGSGSASCSEAPDDMDMDDMCDDDPEDATDDEDWAAVGAAGLRAASYSNRGLAASPCISNVYNGGGMRSVSYNGGGMVRPPQPPHPFTPTSAMGLDPTTAAQEREAVEALLQLGSV